MFARKHILVVEDNVLNREMLIEILADKYEVLEAENGKVALEILRQHRNDIALVLLDIIMPVMDGYTFLDIMKSDIELAGIPVIVMTQGDKEEDELAALSHGASDYIPKPYRPSIILHRIASIINLRETVAMVNQFRYDRLTGLYSKEFFYQRVREMLEQNPDCEYDIICSNVENFKLFNDVFGVREGDNLLRKMADLCKDQVEGYGICGRLNSDRFAVMCKRGEKYSEEIFYDLVARMNAKFNCYNNVIVKWGIYEITDRTIPVEQMCDRALMAADSIKGQYHKYFSVYDCELRDRLLREQAITDGMEEALAGNQISICFQPRYNLKNDSIVGAEALARWEHPKLGTLSPGEFVPMFEKNGFITWMDQFVWNHVCALISEWREKGYPILPVSVNVSRADIYRVDLPDVLMKIVRKHRIDPSYIHLEITESAYTEDSAQIINTVEKLRKQGFVIEMDDFGSGYSSLNMLNEMKVDVLKLDIKFIQSEMKKTDNESILGFVVDLAHRMKLTVVAEGAENREQIERLKEMDCDDVQGFFFAKPMHTEEFECLLKQQLYA